MEDREYTKEMFNLYVAQRKQLDTIVPKSVKEQYIKKEESYKKQLEKQKEIYRRHINEEGDVYREKCRQKNRESYRKTKDKKKELTNKVQDNIERYTQSLNDEDESDQSEIESLFCSEIEEPQIIKKVFNKKSLGF